MLTPLKTNARKTKSLNMFTIINLITDSYEKRK